MLSPHLLPFASRKAFDLGRDVAIVAIVALLATTPGSAGPTQGQDQFLKEWVLANIVFMPTQDGKRSVLIRRLQVRADLRIDVPSVTAEAKLGVSNFSESFGLQVEFTPDRPNLIIVVGSEINDGDKPRKTFLSGLGLPEPAVKMIAETRNWSGGCGYYNFVGRDGGISGTVIAGDRRLLAERLRDCILSGIAFGFGARARPAATFDISNGYIQYLLLSRSMAACENQLRQPADVGIEEQYVDCVIAQLRSRITPQ